ncbi:MAG: tryptophan 7-halogenase [Nannocystaceae bacterium]|nr:tryptophan 7-halogenase [Myxococcales bacterium]
MNKVIPAHATVAIVGGGPGGAMAATLLAREGVDVTLFERETFPRYQIGESLLTSAIPLLKFVELYERVEAHGFVRKHGGYFTLRSGGPPGHIDFRKVSVHQHSYQVIRSEFDHLLLRYAGECGAAVHEATSVVEVEFDGERPTALVVAGEAGRARVTFDHLIDASGRGGLVATRYWRNRRIQPAFENVAVGSYWRGHAPYRAPDGTPQGGDFFMEALADGTGWVWAIPLHDGTLSVGAVTHRRDHQRLRERHKTAEGIYAACLARAPQVTAMLAGAERTAEVRTWNDFSYLADQFARPGARLVGDAAAFIDPLFSTGVHMAFLGALSAAATVAAELRGEVDPEVAARFHDRCVRKAYVRYAVIVAGMYKQIREQDATVLYGVDGADFRRAFDLVLPALTGSLDLGEQLPEEVYRRTVNFTIDMMNERAQLGSESPLARRFLAEAGVHEDLAAEASNAIDGRYIRMERGALGLATLGAEADEIARRAAAIRDRLLAAAR